MAHPDVVQPAYCGSQGFRNGVAEGKMEFNPTDTPVEVDEGVIGQNSVNESIEPLEYKSYRERWWLVVSVAFLNVATDSLWISLASVKSKAAVFYQVSWQGSNEIYGNPTV